MISDPNFRCVTGALNLARTVQLSENWRLAFKARDTETHGQAKPEVHGGIKVWWEGTPKFVRLSQDIKVSTLEAGAHFDIEVTVTFESAVANTGVIKGIAIETDTDTGPVRHILNIENISLDGQGPTCTIVAGAAAIPISSEECRLCIEMDNRPKEVVLRSVMGELRRIDLPLSWESLKEEITHSQSFIDVEMWAENPELAVDFIAAQSIAIKLLRDQIRRDNAAPFVSLKLDRDSLLKCVFSTYDRLGIRQALARIYVHAETLGEQCVAIELLAKRLEVDNRRAANCLYRLSYELNPSTKQAHKLASKMFQNGNIVHASRLLASVPPANYSRKLIAHLQLADALRTGPAIPARHIAVGKPQQDVAYVAAATLPFLISGYATRTHQALRALNQHGVSTTCYARPGFPLDRQDAQNPDVFDAGELTAEGVEYSFSSVGPLVDEPASYIERVSRVLEAKFLSNMPAVVHAASNYMNSLPALIAARRAGVPFIYEVRGLWELTAASKLPGWEATDRFRLDREMETLVAREADHVLAITRGVADELIAGGVPPKKITLLPNAVDPKVFRPIPMDEKLSAKFGIGGQLTLVYAGSLTAYEGLDDLITAIAYMRQKGSGVRLIIVGEGAAGLALKAHVAQMNVGTAVTFVGRVPPDDVVRYLSLADAVAFPRKAFKVCKVVSPLKPFEAMAMGKPVVLTDLPALREIVQHGVTGLLTAPEDPDDLARTLARLAADPDLRTKLGEAGRRWVVRERSWSANAELLKRLYAKVRKSRGFDTCPARADKNEAPTRNTGAWRSIS